MPKIVKAYAKIIGEPNGEVMLKAIETAARISHRSEDGTTDASYKRFIKAVVMDKGDWSIVEHVTLSVDFYVDRGITHELVRHRLFSYTQESTRFVNYEKKMPPSFIYPIPGVECQHCLEDIAFEDGDIGYEEYENVSPQFHTKDMLPCAYDSHWNTAIYRSEYEYKQLLKDGWRPQEARSVLPNALASLLRMTGNLRSWRWFFQMRTSKESHPQMREVTIPLLAEFQKTIPMLFDDIVPNESQAIATAKRH